MASQLSAFVQGIAVPDPLSGELRVFGELQRRQLDLESLACEPHALARRHVQRVRRRDRHHPRGTGRGFSPD